MLIDIIIWLTLGRLVLSVSGLPSVWESTSSGYNSSAQKFNLSTPENVPVGTVVANITSVLPSKGNRISFQIVDGDPYGRFSINHEGSQGVLRVANPLDFRVRPSQTSMAVQLKLVSRTSPEGAFRHLRENHLILPEWLHDRQQEEGIPLQELMAQDEEEEEVAANSRLPWERREEHLKVMKMIGQGTFGHVVLAQLRTPGKEPVLVAAKSISLAHECGDGSERCYRDFYREVDSLISLHDQSEHREGDDQRVHPNIVQLHGIITQSRPRRILLEYAPRGDLLRFLRGSRQDPDTRLSDLLRFAVHVSRALQELETLKIVHRDVAARNVLITEDGVAKLADFGLARDVYATTVYVHTTHLGQDDLLPLKWMALESLRDGVFTSQSDVWSFGVLLWEIATFGEEPRYPRVYRPDCGQLVRLLKRGTRLEKPEECPVSLYRLMCQCWAGDPEDRPDAVQLEPRLEESMDE
ncbi:FGFR3 [Branchiostoma lanceolatum]|uniref:FGFR3 protein n=1 Tax=Branchiostoma lanceolatum TaxID=7740 RepID=A0A8J9ZWR2_BRALA|nr:FGFR3 [Branchiostoma lanceolatum]